MKKVINENTLRSIVAESIKRHLAEAILKEQIKSIVRESIYEMGGLEQFEANEKDEEDGRVSDENNETEQQSNVRKNVINFFTRPGVDHAPYAYKLYDVTPEKGKDTNDMKNARSKFEKCLNGEPNENGYPYSFSSQEINTLKSLTSDNQL